MDEAAHSELHADRNIHDPGNVRPALTPAEWAEGSARGRGCDSDQEFHRHSDGDLSMMEDGAVAAIIGDPATMHALAALALDGQPFGFTWGEVTILLNEARVLQMVTLPLVRSRGDAEHEALLEAKVAGLKSIASRIAALLPPREVAP
jgi:hypothetical protein